MNKQNNNSLPFKFPLFFLIGIGYFIFNTNSGYKPSIFTILLVLGFGGTSFKKINELFKTKTKEEITGLKTCDNCQASISSNERYCPSCGVDLSSTIECDYCGHPNKLGSIICEKCNGLIA